MGPLWAEVLSLSLASPVVGPVAGTVGPFPEVDISARDYWVHNGVPMALAYFVMLVGL